MAVHHGLVLRPPVAQVVVELLQRVFVVTTVALEGDGEIFVRMGVMEGEGAGFVGGGGIMDGATAGQNKKRRKPDAETRIRQLPQQ